MATVPRLAFDAIWSAVEGLLPCHIDNHPLGCHRTRTPDRVVLRILVHRVSTGCSYDEAASVYDLDGRTVRRRRDEWIQAGVFTSLWSEVLAAYNQVVGLVLDDISVDGCITKAPCGGEMAGRSPVDRGKQGTKRSVAVDGRGVPIATVCAPANKVDHQLLVSTLIDLAGLDVPELASLHLDRGYDVKALRGELVERGFDVHVAEKATGVRVRSRQRWVVERTNAWHNQFGQLRRCTDRTEGCVVASVQLANAIILTRRLLQRAHRYTCT
jgi:transposase